MISPKQGGPNEVWSYGEEAYGIISKLLFLREKLRPYIAEQMDRVHKTGLPPMRPLFFDFSDETCKTIDDEYLFGPDILVAPIYAQDVRKRSVYLPQGTVWVDPFTKREIQGGKTVEVDSPLTTIPVFVRAKAAVLNAFVG